jgi:hypothetical protein
VRCLHVADRYGQKELAAPAFCFNASSERWRNSDNSISLIVPFESTRYCPGTPL